MKTKKAEQTNVFEVMGIRKHRAAALKLRSDLMLAIEDEIRRRGLTQVQAAKLFGVSQPRISELVRGKIRLFTLDNLVTMLSTAGLAVNVTLARTEETGGVETGCAATDEGVSDSTPARKHYKRATSATTSRNLGVAP